MGFHNGFCLYTNAISFQGKKRKSSLVSKRGSPPSPFKKHSNSYLDSTSGVEESNSVVNPPASSPLKRHEDEDEDGYVRMDECVGLFPQKGTVLPTKHHKIDTRATKDHFQVRFESALPSPKLGNGRAPVLPKLHLSPPHNRSNITSFANGANMHSNARPDLIQGNVINATVHECTNHDKADATVKQSKPVYANAPEEHDDTVNGSSEISASTKQTVLLPNDSLGSDGLRNVPILNLQAIEIGAEVYDDVIHTPPAAANPVCINHPGSPNTNMNPHAAIEFVVTQDNPAYSTGQGRCVHSNRPNGSAVNEDSSFNAAKKILSPKSPPYPRAQDLCNSAFWTQPKIPKFKDISTKDEGTTHNERSVAKKH